MTCCRSLWQRPRRRWSSSALSRQRCLKAATASTDPPGGHRVSARRTSLSAICSQTDFCPSNLLGCQRDFWTASTSSISAASITYREATSPVSFHRSRSSALTPSRAFGAFASPLFSFRRLAAPFAADMLSVERMRFRAMLPSTGSRISSGTSSSAKSSSRWGTSGPSSPGPPSSSASPASSTAYSSSSPGTGSSGMPELPSSSSGTAPSSNPSSGGSPSASCSKASSSGCASSSSSSRSSPASGCSSSTPSP
mmetsp:Transcript_84419/g.261186  ORF Transcript_84419/g.261186 Transcript_84419/m.261186 type:complete len:253 (+) Transcript_84419:257-1015(+)